MVYTNRIMGLFPRYKDCTFENFEEVPDYSSKINICKNLKYGESLVLLGGIGTGKTHLANAVLKNFPNKLRPEEEIKDIERSLTLQSIHSKNPESVQDAKRLLETGIYKYAPSNCLYISTIDLLDLFNNASTGRINKTKQEVYQELSNYDCICLDDFGADKISETNRQNLFVLIDDRYNKHKSLIVVSNLTIEEIEEVDCRIASRLAEMAEILSFTGEDYRLKAHKAKFKEASRGKYVN